MEVLHAGARLAHTAVRGVSGGRAWGRVRAGHAGPAPELARGQGPRPDREDEAALLGGSYPKEGYPQRYLDRGAIMHKVCAVGWSWSCALRIWLLMRHARCEIMLNELCTCHVHHSRGGRRCAAHGRRAAPHA